jgi:CBS-domain-containing membrane protein
MRVQELMTEGVRTVPSTMAARDAWELMKHDRIRHLVVAEGRQIVGLLSDRDIGGRNGGSARTGRTVADLMAKNVVTIDREETVRKAANLMQGRTIGCLPVTGGGGRLVGIITTADLLGLLGHGGDRPTHQERRTLNFKVPHRRQHRAGGAW